jgi:20S proteasome alpha/beta subunit
MKPQREPMSLVVALANRNSIVLAADTICMLGPSEAHYRYDKEFSKIFPLRNSYYGVGVAAHSTAENFIDCGQPTDAFSTFVSLVHKNVGKHYDQRKLDLDMHFLFCGFLPDGTPSIETLLFDGKDGAEGKREEIGRHIQRACIGMCRHGALYLLHSYHKLDMTTEQMAFLAYFTLREAIFHDERLRGPIQLAVLRPSTRMTFYSSGQQRHLEEVCGKRRQEIAQLITSPIEGLQF